MSLRSRIIIWAFWIIPIALALGLFAALIVLVCVCIYCRERRQRARKLDARGVSNDGAAMKKDSQSRDPQEIPLVTFPGGSPEKRLGEISNN